MRMGMGAGSSFGSDFVNGMPPPVAGCASNILGPCGGIDYPYYGDYSTGRPCTPNDNSTAPADLNCVQWFNSHAIPCNPQSGADCVPKQPRTAESVHGAAAGQGGFMGGVGLWFTDPKLALKTIPAITQLGSMELAAIGFIPVWLGIVSVPVVALWAVMGMGGKR